MRRREEGRSDGGWTFVTNHFVVLFCLAEDPGLRMADVAERVGITERAVQGIVADLVEAGYLTKTRMGRRNHYEIRKGMPMRHLEIQHRQLGEVLRVLGGDGADAGPEPDGATKGA
jgi:predicted ArsR family transcriptional regulator